MLTIAVMLIFSGLNPPAAVAGSGHGGGHSGHAMPTPGAATQGKAVEVELLDLALVDQDGRKVRFKSDVIGDRLVIIDTFYTTCDTICPILSALFVNLQHKLGSRLGRDVVLVSISVDPGIDIPARLKKYAKRHGARPGWIFLTGGKRSVSTAAGRAITSFPSRTWFSAGSRSCGPHGWLKRNEPLGRFIIGSEAPALIRPLRGLYCIATLFKSEYRIPKLETNSKCECSNDQDKRNVQTYRQRTERGR
jgi:cytochrome oxidase Cu insertion factor (SCO1/SenC/PrrC family)